MEGHLSPKDLALAIGVSESSLKRWVDDGRLSATRTSGGHRRIPLHEAVRFIRESAQSVVRPGLLGIPGLSAEASRLVASGKGEAMLVSSLEAGHSEQARGILLSHYLCTSSVASVCDGPIAHAMHRIGELWRHNGQQGIAIEHRATTTCVEALHNIRMLLPPIEGRRPGPAPVAVGGAVETDPYQLPTLMAATCLRELGWRDVNLGATSPTGALLEEARRNGAGLVWMSASAHDAGFDLVAEVTRLAEGVAEIGATLVLGGRAIMGLSLPRLPSTHIVHSMTELTSVAKSLMHRERESKPVVVEPVERSPRPARARV
ncbi:MAG: helix-turn-helix domain-containing protein [Phycisphaerales bacterium]